MGTPSYVTPTRDKPVFLPNNTTVQATLIPKLLRLVVGLFLSLMLLVFIAISTAHLQPLPQPFDLSPNDLAGDPSSQRCETSWYESVPRCNTSLLGLAVYLQPLTKTRTLTRTSDPSQFFTVGQLVAAWGTPTGVLLHARTMRVYWKTRSAMVHTHLLRPDSRVVFILYELDQPDISPWRGFRRP